MSDEPIELFPDGNGVPTCPRCHGRGVVNGELDSDKSYQIMPPTRPCDCTLLSSIFENVRKGWAPLVRVQASKGSELLEYTKKNLHLTAGINDFKAHLRYVANRQHRRWAFKVLSDSDLMTTWLYTAADPYDQDVIDARAHARIDNQVARLQDLVEPYDLLIILLGVKTAANKAMPDVLLEGLRHREIKDLPTWVVDEPGNEFGPDIRSWDEQVQRHIEQWEYLRIENGVAREDIMEARKHRRTAEDVLVEPKGSEDPFEDMESVDGPEVEYTTPKAGSYNAGSALDKLTGSSDDPPKKKYRKKGGFKR